LGGLEGYSWGDPKIKLISDKIFHNFAIDDFDRFGV
jgi:hypothetical protein